MRGLLVDFQDCAPDTEQLFSSLLEVPLGHAHRPVNPMC